MSLIKTVGVSCIVASCIFAGFFKSYSVKSRSRKLSLFCDGLDLLYEYIEQGNCELQAALKKSFSKCSFLTFQNTNTVCKDGDLNADDKEIINSFFISLGRSVKKAECDRINSCKNVMSKRASAAAADTLQKCKLWQTCGICVGLTIGILLI